MSDNLHIAMSTLGCDICAAIDAFTNTYKESSGCPDDWFQVVQAILLGAAIENYKDATDSTAQQAIKAISEALDSVGKAIHVDPRLTH